MRCMVIFMLCGLMAAFGGTTATIQQAITREEAAGATIGVYLCPITGPPLLAHNADRPLCTASLQKLVTGAAALRYLGPSFRFSTQICLSGRISAGVFNGTLRLTGAGDPLLSIRQLRPLTSFFNQHGIHTFLGSIQLDDSVFDHEFYPACWQGRDGASRIYSRISGLNIDHNLYRLRQQANASPVWFPGLATGDYRPEKATRSEARCYFPPAFALRTICHVLATGGVTYTYAPQSKRQNLLFDHALLSPPLSDYISQMYHTSDNLTAECLVKKLGPLIGKGTRTAGCIVLHTFLRPFATAGCTLHDGSGFSRLNRLSARALALMLCRHDQRPYLPLAGEPAFCQRFGPPVPGVRFWFKSGAIYGVRSLSGYAQTASGTYVLVIILNSSRSLSYATIRPLLEGALSLL